MVALAQDRRTPRWETPDGPVISCRLAANTTIHGGSLVQLDANGLAVPASAGTGHVTIGRAEHRAKSGAADEVLVDVRTGVFRWGDGGSGDDAITIAEIGDACYSVDDQTVGKVQGADEQKAGRILQVTGAGVWVATGIPYLY